MWRVSTRDRLRSLLIFIRHAKNPATMRDMWQRRGEGFALFGGEAFCSHARVKELIAREPEKLVGFIGAMNDPETYFGQGLIAFLQKGPNQAARRGMIVTRTEAARGELSRLEETLGLEADIHHAISRFFLEALARIAPTPGEVDDFVFFRESGAVLGIFPKWMRRTVFRSKDLRATGIRKHFLDRFTAAGVPFPDTLFDTIWFNTGALHVYAQLAYAAARDDPKLFDAMSAECQLEPHERAQTRALAMEIIRLNARIVSVNYFEDNRVKIGVVAAAARDPAKFPDPGRIDLTRDHSDSVLFALSAPNRSCPGKDFAPEVMASAIAHLVRKAASMAPRPHGSVKQ